MICESSKECLHQLQALLTSLVVMHLAAAICCCAGKWLWACLAKPAEPADLELGWVAADGARLLAPPWHRDAGQHVLTGPGLLPDDAIAAPMPEASLQHPTRPDHTMPLDAARSTVVHIDQIRLLASAAQAPAAWAPAPVPAQDVHGQEFITSGSSSAKLFRRLRGSAGQLHAAAAQNHPRAVAAACVTSSSSSSPGEHRLPRKLLRSGPRHLHMTGAPDHIQAAATPALYSRKLLQEDASSPASSSPEPQIADSPAAGRARSPAEPVSAPAAGGLDSTATSHAQEPGTAAAAAVLPANSTATSHAQEPGIAAAAAVLVTDGSAPPQAPDSTAAISSAWMSVEPGLAAAVGAVAASSRPAVPLPTIPVASQSPSAQSLGLNTDMQQHKQILIVIGEQFGMNKNCIALHCLASWLSVTP